MALEFSDLKKGTVIVWNNQPHVIMTSQFVRMQQRKPVMQVKMRNLLTGKVVEYSFKSGERVEQADVTKRKSQFLYKDQAGTHFMDQESFETVDLPKDLTAAIEGYLKDGMEVNLIYFEDKPIDVDMPVKIDLKVTSTPPGIKGDTATGGTKPATLETGYVVNVPLFIK